MTAILANRLVASTIPPREHIGAVSRTLPNTDPQYRRCLHVELSSYVVLKNSFYGLRDESFGVG